MEYYDREYTPNNIFSVNDVRNINFKIFGFEKDTILPNPFLDKHFVAFNFCKPHFNK